MAPAIMAVVLGASGVRAQLPLPPHYGLPGPSPLLHPLSIAILILAALGLASTFANMPFDFVVARPSKSSSFKATPEHVKVPSPMPIVKPRTWMGFLLTACLAVVSLQGPLGLTAASPQRGSSPPGYLTQGQWALIQAS